MHTVRNIPVNKTALTYLHKLIQDDLLNYLQVMEQTHPGLSGVDAVYVTFELLQPTEVVEPEHLYLVQPTVDTVKFIQPIT